MDGRIRRERMDLWKPIPVKEDFMPDDVISSESMDELVDFYEYSKGCSKIYRAKPAYYEKGIPGATDKCYMRLGVANLILKAAQYLPQGLYFKIYDAWRPARVQEALFNNYMEYLSSLSENKGKSREQIYQKAIMFVSFPSMDPKRPFVHSTGGAVDLTIVDESFQELDMGTAFDDFSEKAHTAYYETAKLQDEGFEQIRRNRRLLYNVMTGVGFTNLPSEWWHYDYGDRFWSYYTKKPAIYEGILTIERLS